MGGVFGDTVTQVLQAKASQCGALAKIAQRSESLPAAKREPWPGKPAILYWIHLQTAVLSEYLEISLHYTRLVLGLPRPSDNSWPVQMWYRFCDQKTHRHTPNFCECHEPMWGCIKTPYLFELITQNHGTFFLNSYRFLRW